MATIIFKATEACNARCVYCDVVHKDAPVVRRMRPELLETLFVRINEFLLAKPSESIQVIWHGGEPLLLGPEFFGMALEFQNKHCNQTSQRISHDIQSNLTLFSSKFTAAFKGLGIRQVGTSYDPIPGVRGLGDSCDSAAYNRRFMEGVRLLESEGFSWGVIYVVTKLALEKPLDVFHFLVNMNPNGVMLNPILLYERNLEHLRITPEEYVDFLGAIFPTWWRNRSRYPQVAPFSALVQNLIQHERTLSCCESGHCANTHLNLAPDGRVSQCGRAFDWGLFNYGSIRDRSIAEIMDDPQRQELLKRNEILREGECRGCRFWAICHGGCPLDAWSVNKSFMHKSSWCYATKGFIEKYFEPVVTAAPLGEANGVTKRENVRCSEGRTVALPQRRQTPAASERSAGELPWIDPIGGLGDTLMISGVLKQVYDMDPARKFNLVARTKYGPILRGHPAIASIGHPPTGAKLIRTSYWDEPDYDTQRAYQILARMLGLTPPVPETLFVPWSIQEDPSLMAAIPWRERNVLIVPSSESPRKQMPLAKWESFVKRFPRESVNIVQAGTRSTRYVRGCCSLLGLTSPKQIIGLMKRFDVVVTVDNFLMHAAHLCDVPAVVLWGPTEPGIYGYSEHVHLQSRPCCEFSKGCIGPGYLTDYSSTCPQGEGHCLNHIDVDALFKTVEQLLDLETAGSVRACSDKLLNMAAPAAGC